MTKPGTWKSSRFCVWGDRNVLQLFLTTIALFGTNAARGGKTAGDEEKLNFTQLLLLTLTLLRAFAVEVYAHSLPCRKE